MDPTQVAQMFIHAVNTRDVDRVIAFFSTDAVLQDDDANFFVQGEEALRAHFGHFLGRSPDFHSEILTRICLGPWVVQEEHVTGLVLEEPVPEFHILSAYRVEGDKIVKCMGLQ